jgi:hypothetical protein
MWSVEKESTLVAGITLHFDENGHFYLVLISRNRSSATRTIGDDRSIVTLDEAKRLAEEALGA